MMVFPARLCVIPCLLLLIVKPAAYAVASYTLPDTEIGLTNLIKITVAAQVAAANEFPKLACQMRIYC